MCKNTHFKITSIACYGILCHVTSVVHSRSTIAMIFLYICCYALLRVSSFFDIIIYAPSAVMYIQHDYYIIMIIYSLSKDCRMISCYNAT